MELVHLPVLGFVRAELIINCIVAVLVLMVVGLRILGRRLGPGLGWDDALILCATVRLPIYAILVDTADKHRSLSHLRCWSRTVSVS